MPELSFLWVVTAVCEPCDRSQLMWFNPWLAEWSDRAFVSILINLTVVLIRVDTFLPAWESVIMTLNLEFAESVFANATGEETHYR